ncbi:ModD protein [Sulfurospirillum arcachonense]|uniref:ModD protein n=1 Tax=Sulfurospirillum arcachonense TaxID=57666 RepID=UPI00046A2821|nr:ModD protein [Sulfurospirillum arcachonense]
MFNLTDIELMEYIKEDIPYFDLTTYTQNCSDKKARLEIYTREDTLVSCSEESARIAKLLGCKVETCVSSKTLAKKGDVLLSFSGDYEKVHQAWRSSQVILEYSCKMANYAYEMKKIMLKSNPNIELLATRKTFPFAKRFCIKSIMNGGAMPHRLGLSETILFFPNHRLVYKSDEVFYDEVKKIKAKTPEKKVVVESESLEDSISLMQVGVDVIQLDKVSVELLEKVIKYKNKHFVHVKILVAGGVNIKNADKYAKSGVDGIVTSAIYFNGMTDIGCKMSII